MKCLFLATWWPTNDSAISGTFIKEHARAVSQYSEIVALHFKPVKRIFSVWNFPYSYEITSGKEDGMDTFIVTLNVAIRRFGICRYAEKKVLKKVLEKLHKKYSFDLININVLTSDFAELLIEENFLPELPVVVTEHSSFYFSEINLLDETKRKKRKQHLTRLLNSVRIKKILPVSKHLAHTMVNDYEVNPSAVFVVPNIANEIFGFKVNASINVNECNIVLAAHWKYPKNPFTFLKVLNRLTAEELVCYKVDWFGDGPQMKEIKLLAEKINPRVITFHGYQPKSVIAKYLQKANFLLHPSDKENLPCIVIESICCGTPVLSNNVSGVTELIDESNGILVPINDEIKLLAAIKMISLNQKQFDRHKISEAAKKKFSKEVVGAKIFSVYQEIINKPGQ